MTHTVDLRRPIVHDHVAKLEEHVRNQVVGRVRGLTILMHEGGIVLRGQSRSYYAKQLAQHAVMAVTEVPICGNFIEVSCAV
jgi:hypothetical protein